MSAAKRPVGPLSSLGLAILGTTCCALPTLLVLLGAGGAVASLVSSMPWLVVLSEHKALVFSFTALMLAFSWVRLRRVAASCTIADAKLVRNQLRILWATTALLILSVFAAYAAVPILSRLNL